MKSITLVQIALFEKIKVLPKKESLKRVLLSKATGEPRFYLVVDGLYDSDHLDFWTEIQLKLPKDEDFKGSGIQIQVGSEKDWEETNFKVGWNEIKFQL